ncbi:MAG: M1 family aminopeptidase [Cyclobacteriaceae bacterium]
MRTIRPLFLIFLSFLASAGLCQNHQLRFDQIDIQHYKFELELSDESNLIEGTASIDVHFKQEIEQFTLDLIRKVETYGMSVSSVSSKGQTLGFVHLDNQLNIKLDKPAKAGKSEIFEIKYAGIPEDGLIISENMFGNRTFFADNWPDRAQHWLPVVDHPSDKATVEFIITAPLKYEVVASGDLIDQSGNAASRSHHFRSQQPMATKVIVLGAADLAIDSVGFVNDIPVTSWAYPQNQKEAFYDLEISQPILEYFINLIGPYPYSKLASVQATTIYGGMENAGNIFYKETAITGKRENKYTVAHEIAHQWFGNSASEANWHHVWLSEGFATYMTNVHAQAVYGEEVRREKMVEQRTKVIEFSKEKLVPIVDTSVTDYSEDLLNANCYQKASWVLHMLRQKVGDEVFLRGIRNYYDRFKHSNALTDDFSLVMEETSGLRLQKFFEQWIYRSGHPILSVTNANVGDQLKIEIIQVQKNQIFEFPLEIKIVCENRPAIYKTVSITEKQSAFTFDLEEPVQNIELDPNVNLLFELIQ